MHPPGKLYLLPALLSDSAAEDALPHGTLEPARRIRYFLAEQAKSARSLLKSIAHPLPIAQLHIIEIGHEPDRLHFDEWLAPVLRDGIDAAIVSEAGCPGVADPGATLVARAHELGISVRPLVGPSSILLALMASGLNGQQFRFVGYLPREPDALLRRIRELEQASRDGTTQIFIETPYRNERLFAALLETCDPATRLCLAVDLTVPDHERIATHTVAQWRTLPVSKRPSLNRHPTVFLLLGKAGRAPGSGRQ